MEQPDFDAIDVHFFHFQDCQLQGRPLSRSLISDLVSGPSIFIKVDHLLTLNIPHFGLCLSGPKVSVDDQVREALKSSTQLSRGAYQA